MIIYITLAEKEIIEQLASEHPGQDLIIASRIRNLVGEVAWQAMTSVREAKLKVSDNMIMGRIEPANRIQCEPGDVFFPRDSIAM